eukprot:1491898-Amphidinium_carterae.1
MFNLPRVVMYSTFVVQCIWVLLLLHDKDLKELQITTQFPCAMLRVLWGRAPNVCSGSNTPGTTRGPKWI